tara:strand:- start:51060 stop:52097 length:1038 start_codon:yes stop_codon:yes gene_type:complete
LKLEVSERLFVESLFQESISAKKIEEQTIIETNRLTGDASTRRYYRVRTDKNSYVVCLGNALEKNSNLKNEFIEVQQAWKKYDILVPEVYDYKLDKGYILEEDLGDITFLKHLSKKTSKESQYLSYEKVIDELIKIHSIDPKKHYQNTFTKLSFDYSKFMYEVDFCIEWFVEKLIGVSISDSRVKALRKQFEIVCEKISKEHTVVTHRDFHSRNIMVRDDDIRIIDFQDARLGLPQYDLVSVLEDCYYELDRENVYKLKSYYWEKFLKAKKIQPNFEHFEHLYQLMTIQRSFKAIGSFAYIYKTRNDERYLKYIGFGFEKIKKISLKVPELNKLCHLISDIYYEY